MLEWIKQSKNVAEVRAKFYASFLWISVAAQAAYSLIGFYSGDTLLGYFDAFGAIVCALLAYRLQKRSGTSLDGFIGIIFLYLVGIFNFLHGGLYGFSIYWTFVLPPIAMFLIRSRVALFVLVAHIVTTAAYVFLFDLPSAAPKFTAGQYLTYFLSFGSVALLSLLFSLAWDVSETLIMRKSEDMTKLNGQLKSYVKELEQVRKELEQSNHDLHEALEESNRISDVMVNRELKMVELKNKLDQMNNTPATENQSAV